MKAKDIVFFTTATLALSMFMFAPLVAEIAAAQQMPGIELRLEMLAAVEEFAASFESFKYSY